MIDEKIAFRRFAAMSYITLRAYVTLLSLSLSLCITLLGANSLACASVCVCGCAPMRHKLEL